MIYTSAYGAPDTPPEDRECYTNCGKLTSVCSCSEPVICDQCDCEVCECEERNNA